MATLEVTLLCILTSSLDFKSGIVSCSFVGNVEVIPDKELLIALLATIDIATTAAVISVAVNKVNAISPLISTLLTGLLLT